MSNLADDIENMTFGYTTKDKEMTLEDIADLPANTVATTNDTTYDVTLTTAKIAKDKTSYTENTDKTVLVNKDTKFVVYNSDKKTATIYTGAAGLPTAINTAGGSGLPGYAVLKTGSSANTGTASVVFMTHTAAITADGTDVYVYVDASTETKIGSDKYTYEYTRPDGTKERSAEGKQVAADGVYLLKDDGSIDENAPGGGQYKGTGATLNTDEDVKMVKVAGAWYNITDDTQIVYIDDVGKIDGNNGWVVLSLKDGTPTSNAETIFVVKP